MLHWKRNRSTSRPRSGDSPPFLLRRRSLFAAALVATAALGLASRKVPGLFPPILGKYPGDALWAMMAFFAWGFVLPDSTTGRLASYALITSYVDEFTQIYHADWIDEIRRTPIGHLILGTAFSWFDMLAYTVGVSAIVACKALIERVRSISHSS